MLFFTSAHVQNGKAVLRTEDGEIWVVERGDDDLPTLIQATSDRDLEALLGEAEYVPHMRSDVEADADYE